MKVGVYIDTVDNESGGGYTFEKQLISSIIDYQQQKNKSHEFVLVVKSDKYSNGLNGTGIIEIDRNRPFLYEILQKCKLVLRDKKISRGYLERKRIEDILQSSGIDFIIYTKPRDLLTLDIPYMTVVWDLQHRLQPFFPEVSNNTIWKQREDTQKILLQRAAFILTGTNVGKKQIEMFYCVSPDRIIVNPMPVPDFADEFTEEELSAVLVKFGINKPYLLYPALFWPHKNHVTLLKAIKRLNKNSGPYFMLVLTGADPGNGEYIKKYAIRLGVDRQVKFTGYVSQRELCALYRNAFALSYLTLFGPDNLPPLEAFATGCPVIASDIEGAREQLGNAALLVDPLNPDDVVKCIYKLYENQELVKDMTAKGRERIKTLTPENYMNNIITVLDKFEPLRECWSNSDSFTTR